MTFHMPDGDFESWDMIIFSSNGLSYYRDNRRFITTIVGTPEDADVWIIPHNLLCEQIWLDFWSSIGIHCHPEITDEVGNKWSSYMYEEWIWDTAVHEWVDAVPELRDLSYWEPRKRQMENLLMKAYLRSIQWSFPTRWREYVQDHAPTTITRIVLDRILERGDQSYA